jgi:hypothetical protein
MYYHTFSKLKKNYFFFIIIIALFVSCSNSEETDPPTSGTICEGSLNLNIVDIGSDYLSVSWTSDGDYSEYQIEYGLTGYSLGQGTKIQVNTTSSELKNLDPSTDYDIYVRGVCSNSLGNWTSQTTFTTLIHENIFEGHVRLNNQNEVDTFGAMGYTKVNGSLTITGFYENHKPYITDLSSLSSLKEVTNIFSVEFNPTLENLNGLEGIELVGQLDLELNLALKSIRSLSGLKQVTGFTAPEYDYPSQLRISSCDILASLEGLQNISEVDYLIVEGNDELIDLAGLRGISNVSKNISITGAGQLTSLNGLNQLSNVGGDFLIHNQNSLASLEGLENLENVENKLEIHGNNSLVSISALDNLLSVNELLINSNVNLESADGINLDVVQNLCTIAYSGQFTDLRGISGTVTSARLRIIHCYNLVTLAGLETLNEINEIEIWNNPVLENLSGLNGLRTVHNRVYIDDNNNLDNFCAFDGLINIGGFSDEWSVASNFLNPTLEDMQNGNCN